MKIKTGRSVYLTDAETGEVYLKTNKDDTISVRSSEQVENDRRWGTFKRITGRFVKMMDNSTHILKMFRDNMAVAYAMIIMKDYIQPNKNTLEKEGKKYKVNDLAKEMDITRQTAGTYFKKLKKANVLAELDMGSKGKYWVVNPDYFLVGEGVPLEVYKLFEKREKR